MRAAYPFSSQEINDKIYQSYEHLTYLLGYDNISGVLISGFYDIKDSEISDSFLSGVLSLNDRMEIVPTDFGLLSGWLDIADFLKTDYIFRKYYETED